VAEKEVKCEVLMVTFVLNVSRVIHALVHALFLFLFDNENEFDAVGRGDFGG
jgi:hypothetical protein